MSKKLIIANWKMNKTIKESLLFLNNIKKDLNDIDKEKLRVAIAPSYLSLPIFKGLEASLLVGAQNVSFKESGAFTGEISALMLKELKVDFCLVGHSERREYFNENNKTCSLKLKLLEKNNIKAIYCVGEKNKDPNNKEIKSQIREGLLNLSKEYVAKMVIAYEPVFAIGSGKAQDPKNVLKVKKVIKEEIKDMFDKEASESFLFIYGGSVKKDNILDFLSYKEIDGALVGGASLIEDSFLNILKKVNKNEK